MFGVGGVVLAVGVGVLTGCAVDPGPSLKEGCAELHGAYSAVVGSVGLIKVDAGLAAAKVHLDAAREQLAGVRAVTGPAGEFVGLRDDLADETEGMLADVRAAAEGGDQDAAAEASARVQQVILRANALCGWEE